MQAITPCLWFDQADTAVDFYLSVFKNARILETTRYGEAGRELHGKTPGTVMTILFELNGQRFTALNGGPYFKFNEAISLQVGCDTQEEIDYYWEKLGAGGDPAARQCGWLKDQFGLSWQIVPNVLTTLLQGGNTVQSERVMSALLKMKKLDIATLQDAAKQK
jgi:predicted 3-demethylubiquinone-9 3-methyltransferase (glyoxalase superfamily)